MEIRPQGMAIPKETDHLKKGKYGPIYPKTPACHGFTIIAKVISGRESAFYEHAKTLETTLAGAPDFGVLRLEVTGNPVPHGFRNGGTRL